MSPADGGSTQSASVPNAPMVPGSSQRLTLHLGVLVQPYRTPGKKTSAKTTGDVAEILEAKYGLFSTFYAVHETGIVKALESSLEGAIESLLMGRTVDPWGSAMQEVQQEFRDFINSGEAERSGIPGTPTKAAMRGVNHRLKHPYRMGNPRRPSFRDTGMLVNAMRSWID